MAKNLRLNDTEENLLKTKAIQLNMELSKMGLDSIRDTDLCHIILEQTVKNGTIEVTRQGQIRVIAKTNET